MTLAVLVAAILRAGPERFFTGRSSLAWHRLLTAAGALGLVFFALIFILTYIRLAASEPAEAILNDIPSEGERRGEQLSGFVAMEYYALILNRTFLVFIAPEGLYGWKVSGPVTTAQPDYFLPYADLLKDPDMMRDRDAMNRLARLKGGFFIPRSGIAGAEVNYNPKWGMGPIQHSGRVILRMTSGNSREFILLGTVDPDAVQQNILGG